MFDAIEESRVVKPHVDDIPEMPDDISPEPTVIPHEDEENKPETPKPTDEPKKEDKRAKKGDKQPGWMKSLKDRINRIMTEDDEDDEQ